MGNERELVELVAGVDFGEGPRWHDGRLWYSDFYQASIYSVDESGRRRVEFDDLPDRPSGLGWLPDGTLIVVAMTSRSLWRETDGQLVPFADLGEVATGNCNDMVVNANGDAYVGNFGFDMEAGESFATASLALVRSDGTVSVAADGMRFPNGSVITPDGSTLIVGESFSGCYIAFDIAADGSLDNRRVWADIPGTAPDGCALDAEGGIWFSDALGSRVLRVVEGGEVTDEIATPMPTYACMLGGDAGTTLFILCAPGSHPDEVAGKGEGVILSTMVEHRRAGLP